MKSIIHTIIYRYCVKTSSHYFADTVILNIKKEIEQLVDDGYSFTDKINYNNAKDGIGKDFFNLTRKEKLIIRNGYDSHFYFYINGCYFLVSYNPTSSLVPYARVAFNIDHFSSFVALEDTLSKIWNKKVAQYLIYLATVRRIDFCVDLDMDYESISKMAFRKSVRWTRESCSDKESITLGVLATDSEQHIIYEKNKTRIEARFTGKRCPIHHLVDLASLKDFDPFNKLKLYHLDLSKVDMQKFRESTAHKIKSFYEDYEKYGFFKARKRANKERNFSRIILPKIKAGLTELNVSTPWRENRLHFFKGRSIGVWPRVLNAGVRHKLKKEILSFNLSMPTVLKTSSIHK